MKIYSKHLFWQKWEILKPLKLQRLGKTNFTYFVSFSFGENLLKNFFWQKLEILNALKFQQLENANFTHFFKRPLGENHSDFSFDKSKAFLKLWSLKSSKMKDFSHFVSCPFPQKYPKTSLNQHFQTMFLKLTSALLKTRSMLFTGRPLRCRGLPARLQESEKLHYMHTSFQIIVFCKCISQILFLKKNIRKALPLILTPALRAAGSSLVD